MPSGVNPGAEPDQLTQQFVLTLPLDTDTDFDLVITAVSKETSNGDEEIDRWRGLGGWRLLGNGRARRAREAGPVEVRQRAGSDNVGNSTGAPCAC